MAVAAAGSGKGHPEIRRNKFMGGFGRPFLFAILWDWP
jgi:hypothetical protein